MQECRSALSCRHACGRPLSVYDARLLPLLLTHRQDAHVRQHLAGRVQSQRIL